MKNFTLQQLTNRPQVTGLVKLSSPLLTAFGAAVTLLALAGTLSAQGTLSSQGFGYPTGQLSLRALGAGGAIAEIDPISQLNPASVGRWGRSGVTAQFAPEYRTLLGPGGNDGTTTARFPHYSAGIALANRWMLGIATSTLLDRNWSTRYQSTVELGGEQVESATLWTSQGAINDVAFSVSYGILSSLQVGAAAHLITGSNKVSVATDYASPAFGDLGISTSFSYSGSAFGAGLVWSPVSQVTIGASTRIGGLIHTRRTGEENTEADVPGRYGLSVGYSPVDGTTIAARYEKVNFSDLNGLGTASTLARDTEEMGIGSEFPGPGLLGSTTSIRVGARWRNLPYDAAGSEVRENSFSVGLGVPFARDRAALDFGLLRLKRSNGSEFSERAWIFGMGILVRP